MRIPRQTGRSFQTKLDTDPTANWRLNDKTDQGDEVISASSGTVVLGHQAAIWGDTTYCLAYKGTFAQALRLPRGRHGVWSEADKLSDMNN